MSKKFITRDGITAWLDAMSKERVVLMPMRDGKSVTFRPYVEGRDVELDDIPVASPKEGVFPQTETLLTYKYVKDAETLESTVEVTETLPQEQAVVFGSRPCGARGQLIFDRVYNCDAIRDPYYSTRRENTAYITIACTRAEPTCFCHSVGSGPADTAGSDILLTPVEDGFVVEAVSERGSALLAFGTFTDAGDKAAKADAAVQEALEKMGDAHDYSTAPEKLMARFDDTEFWQEQSAKCISCGACTYLCPTCYCFNITDEKSGPSGRRVRTWDNCMSNEFTLEGSGHNPRTTKALRLRNRMGHKFAYYPQLHEGIIACCGCGRCIKSCPVSVDIRAVVQAAQEYKDA